MTKYWISTSGGVASAISAMIAHIHGLDFELIFADTLIEDEDLYRFVYEVAARVHKPVIHLKDGRNPWQVFIDKKFIGNSRTAHCSSILKTAQVFQYLKQHANPGDILVLGMDLSELDRIERAQKNWAPRKVHSFINEYKVWRPQWKNLFTIYNVKQPRLYEYGFLHNNCGGMCVRAGLKQFATLLEWFPDRYMWHEQWQEYAVSAIGPTARPFLRHTVNGVLRYLTMREFREGYQAGIIKVDPYDIGGCACFVDE